MYLEYTFATPALRELVRSAWSVSYGSSSETMPGIIAPDAHVEFLFQTGAPCATRAEHGALRLVPTGDNGRNLGLQNALIWEIAGNPVSTPSDSLGFSVRSLRRYCEKYAGLSPKQLVMSGRMLRACALLIDRHDFTISDIVDRRDLNGARRQLFDRRRSP